MRRSTHYLVRNMRTRASEEDDGTCNHGSAKGIEKGGLLYIS